MSMAVKCALATMAASFAFAACQGPDVDKPATAASPARRSEASTSPPATAQSEPSLTVAVASSTAPPPLVIAEAPPGTIYVCVTEVAGQPRQTAIEFSPQVVALCRKAPEMGPCQYAREACRSNGGRVFTVDGTEITRQTEAEYDKRVMRIRMKSN